MFTYRRQKPGQVFDNGPAKLCLVLILIRHSNRFHTGTAESNTFIAQQFAHAVFQNAFIHKNGITDDILYCHFIRTHWHDGILVSIPVTPFCQISLTAHPFHDFRYKFLKQGKVIFIHEIRINIVRFPFLCCKNKIITFAKRDCMVKLFLTIHHCRYVGFVFAPERNPSSVIIKGIHLQSGANRLYCLYASVQIRQQHYPVAAYNACNKTCRCAIYSNFTGIHNIFLSWI